jgi:hypothetical protein
VVEVTALEMRHTRKGIVGSNPTLSAKFLKFFGSSGICEPTISTREGALTKMGGSNPNIEAKFLKFFGSSGICEPTVPARTGALRDAC